ncbi:MAG: dTDP-4-dehydrorhamnose reductase [Lachnospiraceae bacterium]|nr:dTDP-4-dehydrorhamnose reductase [Lachnospiraceae bacterium]
MKKILVTGCNGQLGRAINKEYENDDVMLINTDVAELDITDIKAVMGFVNEKKPDVIINCAAHTNVNLCESQWDLAYKINAIGPRNLSIAATSVGAKMIHVSTDYVFDGSATEPYDEFSPVAPLGAYGKTKLEGENFVKQFADKFFIVRTAWLYGDGKNFVKTMINIGKEKGEVGVVADQVGSPTSAKELAKAIHVLEPTDNYGVFHGTCEGYCSWADFAEKIFEYAGMDVKVKRLTTDEYPTPAKRPAYSVLNNYMLTLTTDFKFGQWEDALKEYFEEMN